jgi:serine/threonine protein kinase/tetratricopeptide (TPR) repeat protein
MAPRPPEANRRSEIESIFEDAIELSLEDRRRWLTGRCGADSQLRAEVDALIIAHERVEGVLEGNVAAAGVRALRDSHRGRRIGAYRVLSELGRGGMGVVYLAERNDGQYEQRVAVKLLHASPDVEHLHRRFIAERQILASLRHRGIAQLLDGGVTEGQLPFLVMEYVDGVPITAYCDRRKLGIDARLRLFRDVCGAVHHAHQNLIIHCDIKPGNILVSPEGEVRLLDFGIAKLLSPGRDPSQPTITRTELRALTPEYASPEQIRGETVTTASDVYALGVVLYELLAGRRPYSLESGSPHELTEVICSRVPERPSAVVTDERVRRTLRGDLDAIVMMALRKEARDRYGSVDLLWEDLGRYLDGLPVHAHRGSRLYRARKFLGRHRVESAAAAIVAVSLAAGAGVAVRQATIAARERDRAQRALAEAEQSIKQSESVTGFLVGLFDPTAPNPGATTVSAQELVRRGVAQIETFRGQPLIQAQMLVTIARVQMIMADYPQARVELERSLALRVAKLGPNHVDVAETLLYLGEMMRRAGHYQQADTLTRRALAIRTAALGPRHPANAEILLQLASIALYLSDLNGAQDFARRALEIRRTSLGPNDPLIGESLAAYAAMLRRLDRNAEAETALREAIAVYHAAAGPQSVDAANLQLRVAELTLAVQGDTAQAESLIRSTLAITRASLGDHPRTSWAMSDLAELLSHRGQYREAEQLARAGLEIQRRTFGAQHPNVAAYASVLVAVYVRAGRLAEAERTQRESIAILGRTLGENHTAYAGSLGALSEILMERGRFDEAIALRQRCIDIRRRIFGEETGSRGIDMGRLARVYARKRDFSVADSLFRAALANQLQYVSETHYDVRTIYGFMSERYRLERRPAEAERYARMAQAH